MATLGERLGFEAGERVVVVHADDIGMCHAANVGAFEALDNGPATCGSVMVPCPWAAEAFAWAAERPDVDLGVHLTLNAEWPGYRWGPVAGAEAVPSLVDERGHLLRTVLDTLARAKPEDVRRELRAQVETALAAGLDVTHLDAHMGTALMPPFVDIYLELAREFRLPAFAVKPRVEDLGAGAAVGVQPMLDALAAWEAEGGVVMDGYDIHSLDFPPDGDGVAHNRARLGRLPAGVSYLVCHPAMASPELSAVAPEAHCRDFERRFYGGEEGRAVLEELGFRTVGMRALRALQRGGG